MHEMLKNHDQRDPLDFVSIQLLWLSKSSWRY